MGKLWKTDYFCGHFIIFWLLCQMNYHHSAKTLQGFPTFTETDEVGAQEVRGQRQLAIARDLEC